MLIESYRTGSRQNNPNNRRCHHRFFEIETGHVGSRHKCNLIHQNRHGNRSFDYIAPMPTHIGHCYIEIDRRN